MSTIEASGSPAGLVDNGTILSITLGALQHNALEVILSSHLRLIDSIANSLCDLVTLLDGENGLNNVVLDSFLETAK